MKALIATYYSSHNYGAVLQAYALAEFMQSVLGIESTFLNYRTTSSVNTYSFFPKLTRVRDLKRLAQFVLRYRTIRKRFNGFVRFQESCFTLTKLYSGSSDIECDFPCADFYITGSDQVFRYRNKEWDPYFLSFVPGEKPTIAYAPSFGAVELPIEHHDKVAQLLSRIKYLSCREKQGAEFIARLTGRNVPTVLDPVFLLERDHWCRFADKSNCPEGGYILCYALVGHQHQIRYARQLNKQTGLPIILITSPYVSVKNVVNRSGSNPMQFVGLFEKASFVITDSFHGTAFSLLFTRPFLSLIVTESSSSRIIDLLTGSGMESHIVFPGADPARIDLSVLVDYSNYKIEHRLKESQAFLTCALEGD